MAKENYRKINKSRAIRRLVIWYKRNTAVTSIVDSAANSAATASNVAENVVSSAGSVVNTASNVAGNVVSSAGSLAKNPLQPLVFDPLKRLQAGENENNKDDIANNKRVWIAVDGMGGDHAPGPILEGCLDAIQRFPINIKFVGQIDKINEASRRNGLNELMEKEIQNSRFELVPSGSPIGMNEEATAVRKKKEASINVAMNLVKSNEAKAVYSAGNSGALMASAIFRIGRLKGIDRPAIGALFPTRDQSRPVLVFLSC